MFAHQPDYQDPKKTDFSIDYTITVDPRTMPHPRQIEAWFKNETRHFIAMRNCKLLKPSSYRLYDFFPLIDVRPDLKENCPDCCRILIHDSSRNVFAIEEPCMMIAVTRKQMYFYPDNCVITTDWFNDSQRTSIPESQLPQKLKDRWINPGVRGPVGEHIEVYSFYNSANCNCACKYAEIENFERVTTVDQLSDANDLIQPWGERY